MLTYDEHLNSLKNAEIIALDFETNYNPEEDDGRKNYSMTIFSVAYRDKDGVLQAFAEENKESKFLDFWEIVKEKTIVFHNAKFDLMVIKEFFRNMGFKIELTKIKFEDTLIIAHLLDETQVKKLKVLRQTVLGKPERDTWNLVDKTNIEEYLEYAKQDAIDTLELYEKTFPDIADEDLEVVYELEKQVIFPIIDMEFYGVILDLDLHKRQKEYIYKVIEDLEKEILEMIPKRIVKIKPKKSKPDENLEKEEDYNLASPKQLQELFFDVLEYEPKPAWQTKTGYSVNEAVLTHISHDNSNPKSKKVAEKLVEHRYFSKIRNAFIDGLEKKLDGRRVYPSFNSLGTISGRFSSSAPNLQQISAKAFEYLKDEKGNFILDEKGEKQEDLDYHLRSLFVPQKGCKFVTSDLSQIELRMAAILSRDKSLCEAFVEGEDLHQNMVDFLGMQGLHIERRQAKILNFGILYGMGAGALSAQSGMSFQDSMMAIHGYWEAHPGLERFVQDMSDNIRQHGYLRTISGRKRRFLYTDESSVRSGINTFVQGGSADLMKLIMINIYKEINRKKARFVMTVHDEITLEVKEDYVDEAKAIVSKYMGGSLKTVIPIEYSLNVGSKWSESK